MPLFFILFTILFCGSVESPPSALAVLGVLLGKWFWLRSPEITFPNTRIRNCSHFSNVRMTPLLGSSHQINILMFYGQFSPENENGKPVAACSLSPCLFTITLAETLSIDVERIAGIKGQFSLSLLFINLDSQTAVF